MRSKTALFLLCLTCWFISFAHADTVAPAAAAQRAGDATQPRGSLYRIRHQGNTSYLFGTVHVGRASYYPLEPRVLKAFGETQRLVVEFDIRNMADVAAALGKYGMYPSGDSIEKRIAPENLARLRAAIQRAGLPFGQMTQMKPWMLANLLAVMEFERNGYAASQGSDLYFLGLAEQQSKPVLELETADYQLSLLDAMPATAQEQYMRETLEELASGKSLRKAMELMHAWSRANGAAFDAILREAIEENTLSSRFMLETLLYRRNLEMADKIDGYLKSGKTSFVAVGLMHLIGEKGLPAVLKGKGYEVEKVY